MAIAKVLILVLAAGCVASQIHTTPEPDDYDDGSQQGVQLELRFPKLEYQNQQMAQVLSGIVAKLNKLQTIITNRLGKLTYVGC